MDFDLSPELAALQQSVRRLAQDKVKPRAREIDATGEYPTDIFDAFRQADLLGLCLPTELGGSGAGILGLTVAIEEVAKYSNAAALMLLLTRLPVGPVLIAGSEEQKKRYLPGIASGELRAGFGLSEAQAGSDVAGMATRAVPGPGAGADGGWVLNGTKCWMSGVREADWYTVFAKTGDPSSRAHDSITAFIVERGWDGVSVGRTDHKMGVRGVDTGELVLDDVHVPAENVIGEVGGFRLAMLGLNAMRPIVAARGIGLAEGALMYATEYVQQREAFGRTIADFQGIQWEIAKLAVDIEAARLLTYRSAWLADQGKFTKEYVPFLSMAKYYATELAVRASGLAVQLLGAAGYMEDHPDRALVPGCPTAHHRGGDLAGPAGPDRQGRAGPRPVVGLMPTRAGSTGRGPGPTSASSTGPEPGFDQLGGWPGVLTGLLDGTSLTTPAAETVFGEILSGDATPAQISALALALRAKGESVEEMTGFVRAMVAHAVPLDLPAGVEMVDTCGTGGDRLRSINVSTIAALVVAATGAKVCKHGGRASSSAVGAADVLEALGVVADLGPRGVARCIDEVGMGFCFAPRFHPAMRFAAPVRKELGIPTVFNYLGPLANPGRARFQVVGVSNPAMADTMLGVLAANGARRAMIVYGDDGLDELSTTGPSTVHELVVDEAGEYETARYRIDPGDLGLAPATIEELRGGDAAFNAQAIRQVIDGQASPHRDIAVLNAAAALLVIGQVADLPAGVALACEVIDDGRAERVLEALIRVSVAAAADEPPG